VTGAIVVLSLAVGTERISLAQAWGELRQGLPRSEAPTLSVVLELRLPRTLLALIAGSALALAGCSFQALLRNPLATPYTLGIASFGALGAYAAMVFGLTWNFMGFGPVVLSAFLFAGFDVLVVYVLAVQRGRFSPAVLLLAGVTMGMLANAGILLLRYMAKPEEVVNMDRFLMGGVDVQGYDAVIFLALTATPCLAFLLAQATRFDQLSFGTELAAGRGVNVTRLQVLTFLIGSLLTALLVANVGPIGFVGLMVPHAVRAFTGSRHRILMPLTVLAGGPFLCVCDIVSRVVLAHETPIGIITTLLGGPFFLYLLMRRRLTDWEV
jgi:iron complex transport system permease protein